MTQPPAEIAHRLRLALLPLVRALRSHVEDDMTSTLMSALGTVGRADGLTLGALAEAENVTPPMATKLANGLAERGLVNRVGCREDGRVVRLEMTPDGRALLRKNQGRRTAWLAERIDALDQTERAQLQDAIEIIERLSRPALVPA